MTSGKALIRAAFVLALAGTAPPTFAQDDDEISAASEGEASENGTDAEEDEGVETEDIFGFTEGSDTGEKGEREVSSELLIRAGKRILFDPAVDPPTGDDDYLAVSEEVEFEYGLTDNLKVSFAASAAFVDWDNVYEPGSFESGGFNGLESELKWQPIKRNQASPFGIAFALGSEWSRFDEAEGEQEDSLALNVRGMADVELVPDRVFGAFNISYEPEWAHVHAVDDDTGEFVDWERESGLELSSALSGQIADGVFLGAESRFLVAGEGLAFDEVAGHALFVGPTFAWQFAERASLKAAWSVQVAGESDDDPGDDLDLANFEEHQALLQFGLEF